MGYPIEKKKKIKLDEIEKQIPDFTSKGECHGPISLREYKKPLKNCDKVADYINSLKVIDHDSKESVISNSVKNSIIKDLLSINNRKAKTILQVLSNHGFLYRKMVGIGRTSLFFKKKNLTEQDVIEASQY